MTTITYDEFLLLPKGPPTKKLIPGKTYYIKNGVRKMKSQIDVYIGKFDKISQNGSSFYFDDVEYLVKVPTQIKTSGYGKSGWIYTEALPTSPTQEDHERKKIHVSEIKNFLNEKKAEPIDRRPSISFIGEDYRKARNAFNKGTRVRSRSKSSGGKKSKRKTMKKPCNCGIFGFRF